MRMVRMFFLVAFLSGSLLFSNSCAARPIYVKTAPPAVKVEVRPAPPYRGAVWVPGHWAWRHGRYVWVKGHWVKPRHGYVYVPGHWVKKRYGWVWVSGHWKRI